METKIWVIDFTVAPGLEETYRGYIIISANNIETAISASEEYLLRKGYNLLKISATSYLPTSDREILKHKMWKV